MIILFVFLLIGAHSQQCNPMLFDDYEVGTLIFGDLTGKGGSAGRLAVGGDATLEQFSIGARLPNNAEYSMIVSGNLDFKCGDVTAHVYYSGQATLGARIDWNNNDPISMPSNSVVNFVNSQTYYEDMHGALAELGLEAQGGSLQGGGALMFIGRTRDIELFRVSCQTLASTRNIMFENIQNTDSTMILINVFGTGDCSMNIQSVQGLPSAFNEPSTRILWNFQARSLSIQGSVIGSVLAPGTSVTSDHVHFEAQAILREFNGTGFFGASRFRGCVPSEECFVGGQDCPVVTMPVPCFNPQAVPNPEQPCCEIFQCAESCPDPPQCSDMPSCRSGFVAEITVPAGNPEGDPCCDVYACLRDESVTAEDPRNILCPEDIVVTLPAGSSQIQVTWDRPTFVFASSVTSNFQSGDVFTQGEEIVEYVALGLKPNTMTYCMFSVNVISTSVDNNCVVGGQVYQDGDFLFNNCLERCICIAGNIRNCVRLRKELQSMDEGERALYFQVYKAVYNHNDETHQQYINNHQQFFSRGLHNNGAFLPWHRGYILEVENRLREEDCRVTIPYWNWRLHPRISTSHIFGLDPHQASANGDSGTRCVSQGTFGSTNGYQQTNGRCLQRRIGGGSARGVTQTQIGLINRYPLPSNYDAFRNRLEHGPGLHDSIHCLVGGTMCSARASNDPLFFSHHANIDKIWSEWQSLSDAHVTAYSGNTGFDSLMPISRWTPRHMMNLLEQPGGVSVHYEVASEAENILNDLIRQMTPEELQLGGNVAVGPVGRQFLEDMNMAIEDQDVIRKAEEIANRDVIQEIVALTLSKGPERALELPGFQQTLEAVANRLAQDYRGEIPVSLDARLVWRALTDYFVASNLVPRFVEIQNIIVEDSDGNEIETVAIPVEIECAVDNRPVCANGINFPNECEANANGYNVDSVGPCPPPDPPITAVSEEIDGGESDAYNHELQELSECPDTLPLAFSRCDVLGVQCFYGLFCCDAFQHTVTCFRNQWRIASLPWSDCSDAACGVAIEANGANTGSVELIPRPTLPPTEPPTRNPTQAPTLSPTLPPTRSPTLPPTFPRLNRHDIVQPRPTIPPPQPTSRPVTPPPLSNQQSILPSAIRRPTTTAQWIPRPPTPPTRPRLVPRPVRPVRPVPITARPPARQIVLPPRQPSITASRPSFTSVTSTVTSTVTSFPPIPPLVVVPRSCPLTEVCGPTPICCNEGFDVGTLPILNSLGQECGRSCPECVRTNVQGEYVQDRVPECCVAALACETPQCGPGETLELRQLRGANYARPCCDVHVCVTTDRCATFTCPTLEEQTCMFPQFQIPAYAQGMDPTGCCQRIDCVTNICFGPPRRCPDGSTVPRDPAALPRCSFPDCPIRCTNPDQQQFCPATGGTQIPRVRNLAPDCTWQPCPDYDPCEDANYLPRPCGEFGTCVPGFSELTCECQESYSGPLCGTFEPPPRPTFTLYTRSFALSDSCEAFMCRQSSCYYSENSGVSWDQLDTALFSLSGISSDYAWFVNEDNHIASYDRGTGEILSTRDVDTVYQNIVSLGGLQESRITFSYYDVIEGELPPASEQQHMINYASDLSWTGPCQFMVFLTDEKVVFYTSQEMHSTEWGTLVHGYQAETVELCEDKCLDAQGNKQTCSDNGICDRADGVCHCDYGYSGDFCETSE